MYGGLTAILAGIYTAAIRLFNWLFEEFTGERSDAALVLTTLVLATILTPIKNWLESRVVARRNALADSSAAEAADDGSGEFGDERIAQRAAVIVMRQLGALGDGRAASRTAGESTHRSNPTRRQPRIRNVNSPGQSPPF